MGFRSAREKAGLTVIQAKKLLGVSDAAIYMWETGKTAPKLSRLRQVAEVYRCTVDELLSEDTENGGD